METSKEDLVLSRVVDGVVVISFNRGRIRDEREILKAFDRLARLVELKDGIWIVLDLENVEYLSSAGLGHLVGLLKKARAKGSTLKLCCLRDPIKELFEVMRLTKIFEIHPKVDDALKSFTALSPAGQAGTGPQAAVKQST